MSFKRFYNALDTHERSMGIGWVHNYEVYLEFEDDSSCTLLKEEGAQECFVKESEQTYRSFRSGLEIIEVIETEKMEDTVGYPKKRYVYKDIKGLCYFFDQNGHLLEQKDINGNTILFYYNDEGKLEQVKIAEDQFLHYTYHPNGRLASVTDYVGRTVMMEYQIGKLQKVTDPSGGVMRYHYNREGKISSVTNPKGINTLNNTYDKYGRITKQCFPDGGEMRYEYRDNENQVILTERNGSKITYVHDNKYRSVKNIYGDGEESFVYNDRDEKVLYRDKRGNETRYVYDDEGNLSQIKNALGDNIDLDYEVHHKLTKVCLNGILKVKNEYDNNANRIKTTDAIGRSQQFVYNKQGLVTRVIQADGSQMQLSYDRKGNLTYVIDPRGSRTTYEYDVFNRVIRTVDGNGNEMAYQYDSNHHLTEIRNAQGNTRYYAYNKSGKVTSVKDFNDSIVKYEYNEINQPKRIVDALGNETCYEYDSMWNICKRIGPDGAETMYHYDEQGRIESVMDALGSRTSFTYDPNGNCTRITDAEGNSTCFTYDALNRRIERKEANGALTKYFYNKGGQLNKEVNALGGVTSIEYDDAGQKIRETDALGRSWCYTYYEMGQVRSVKDSAGRETKYEYEKGGLLAAVFRSDGTWEKYTYDNNQNVIQLETSEKGSIHYVYDNLNRIQSAYDSRGREQNYYYDPIGRITSVTDAAGYATKYCYDSKGNLIKVTDALGESAEYCYDAYGKLIQQGRHERSTLYRRDPVGRIKEIIDPLGETESYRYDQTGHIIEKTDKEGGVTLYGYTPVGDLESIEYGDGREVYLSYNALRQLEEMRDWLGITRIENNALGKPVRVTDHNGREVSYCWGRYGERESITYPDGKTISYKYNEHMRLKEVSNDSTQVFYSYNDIGQLREKAFSNGQKSDYEYDTSGQLQTLTNWNQGEIIDHYEYSYDTRGNKTKINKQRRNLPEESGCYHYVYDALNRLQSVSKDESIQRRYAYDSYGNRAELTEGTQKTYYTYNKVNQLIHKVERVTEGNQHSMINVLEETYRYDPRGNLREIWKDGKLSNQYFFGALNRLEKAADHQTGMGAAYIYDGMGNRVGKEEGALPDSILTEGKLEEMVLDQERRIQDVLDRTKEYRNLLQRYEEGQVTSFIWDRNVLSATSDKETYHYLQDELGSPIRLIDREGAEIGHYGYDEFGIQLYSDQENLQPFDYTGYQKDNISGTNFAQAREYQTNIGRFISQDIVPGYLMVPDSLNRYTYCYNQPIDYIDLNGLTREEAREYMYQYATDEDDERNPDYPSWNVNCANFVSQSLVAGGLEPIAGEWFVSEKYKSSLIEPKWWLKLLALTTRGLGANIYYNHETRNAYPVFVSDTWNNANNHFEYFSNVNNNYMNGEVIKVDIDNLAEVLANNKIQTGDLLYWGDDDNKYHATIISDVTELDILYAGNTSARFDESLAEALGGRTVYIVPLKDELFSECGLE